MPYRMAVKLYMKLQIVIRFADLINDSLLNDVLECPCCFIRDDRGGASHVLKRQVLLQKANNYGHMHIQNKHLTDLSKRATSTCMYVHAWMDKHYELSAHAHTHTHTHTHTPIFRSRFGRCLSCHLPRLLVQVGLLQGCYSLLHLVFKKVRNTHTYHNILATCPCHKHPHTYYKIRDYSPLVSINRSQNLLL